MQGSKKGTYYWFKFMFPDKYEKDPEFRDYFVRLNRPALLSAGIIAISFVIVHVGIYSLIFGRKFTWVGMPEETPIITVADKLLIIFLGVICVVLSRIRLHPQAARIIFSLLLLSVGLVSYTDDILRGDISRSLAYFVLCLLVGVGTISFRPWQIFILGVIFTLLFNLWPGYLATLLGTEPLIPASEASVLLILTTCVCSVITAIIYRSRYRLFRSRQKEKKLREAVSDYATELEEICYKLRETQDQLVQSKKMAALGNLVAGVAHEINTPLGAVNSMYDSLSRSLEKIRGYMDSGIPMDKKECDKINKALEIVHESDRVIRTGIDRIADIVSRLRSFSRLDEAEFKTVDIHECLEDTLVLAYHELKKNIEVVKNYGDVPPISCFPGQLNQVFLNLLINSKHAIKDQGTITITTFTQNAKVFILFEDDGEGINEENLPKVFDPGFTTKGRGVGTGLGLSISYKIIENHRGEIKVESERGVGTSFTIILPANLEDLIKDEKSQYST